MKPWLFLIIVPLLYISSIAQNLDTEKLDAYFKALEDHNKFMGTVAVSRNGKTLYTKSIGFADADNKIKATENSRYRVGSISKTFTAALIMKAAEEGLLSLDQSLDAYYPAVQNASTITIRHLLSHRTGIKDFTASEAYTTWLSKPKTKAEMLDIFSNSSEFEPGSKFSYSNSNFLLLSYILEDLYKKPYAVVLKEKIIDPLGLKHTYYGGPIDVSNNECLSYTYMASWEKEVETDMSIPLGGGGIVSNPHDLLLFADALFGGKIISMKSVDEMMVLKDNYGLGLFQVPFNEKRGYGHTGGIDGFAAAFFYFPADKVGYAMTSNGSTYDNNEIAIAVLSALYDHPYEIPVFKTYLITTEELKPLLGTYSSTQIPLKITISNRDNIMIAQATGQPSFPLQAMSPTTFKFEQYGVELRFDPGDNSMLLLQRGQEILFTKDK